MRLWISTLALFLVAASLAASSAVGHDLTELGGCNHRTDGDCDGLSNEQEEALGTDPANGDSDDDGVADGIETRLGTDPLTADGPKEGFWWDRDSDRDGESDRDELELGLDPLNPDTDGDGVTDGAELDRGSSPWRADPADWNPDDRDSDGVTNDQEATFNLNQLDPDTAGDGRGDKVFIKQLVEQRYNGDVIHDADLRALGGVEATRDQRTAFETKVAELLASNDILAVGRGYGALETVTGKKTPAEFDRKFTNFLKDVDLALQDRDVDAFVRVIEARGSEPTAGQIDAFKNPSGGDLVADARLISLTWDGVREGSKLDSMLNGYTGSTASGAGSSESAGSTGSHTGGWFSNGGYAADGFKQVALYPSHDGKSAVQVWVGPDTTTTVTETHTETDGGGSTTTTVVTDEYGDVIYSSTTETDADGNSKTTSTTPGVGETVTSTNDTGTGGDEEDEDDNDDDDDDDGTGTTAVALTAGDGSDGTGTLFGAVLQLGPTRLEMLGQPSNNPNDPPPGDYDADGDGEPDFVEGRLGGVIDPHPDGETGVVNITAGAIYHFNGAGPEYGPDGPDTPDVDGPPQHDPYGPISVWP